ncbi:MAG: TRAP transporter small permease [Acetivibrionales bacterium]|jgi:TRAP-type C4-dicarboxylate transport system permease small subunit
MNKFGSIVEKAARILDGISGWCIVFAMALVVVNIILRAVFKSPILGTYEYTEFLTALIVGCGLANCTLGDGHIAIDFLVEKLNKRTQNIIASITGIIALCFMVLFTIQLFINAGQLAASGEVSPTTQTPYYIFVYITALCFAVLSLAILSRTLQSIKGVVDR